MKNDLIAPLVFVGLVLIAPSRAAAAKDACSLMSAADAEAALGEPVGAPVSEPRSSGASDGSECKFKSTQGRALKGKNVALTVQYATSDVTGSTKGIADNLRSAGMKNVHEVSGVGDGAVWGSTSMMGRPMGELSVLKGKHIMLIILINGIADEADSLSRAKALAAKVLPKA